MGAQWMVLESFTKACRSHAKVAPRYLRYILSAILWGRVPRRGVGGHLGISSHRGGLG